MQLLAKSDGETLIEHTSKLLSIFNNLVKLFDLNDMLRDSLTLAIILHDIGKSAEGFQRLLREEINSWNYRHELLSLVILELLDIEGLMKKYISLAISTHHKSIDLLCRLYSTTRSGNMVLFREMSSEMNEHLPEIYEFLDYFADKYRGTRVGDILSRYKRVSDVTEIDFNPFEYLIDYKDNKSVDKVIGIILRGVLTACDHLASAGLDSIERLPNNVDFTPRCEDFIELNDIQETMRATKGSVILVSPTGSGKTEAALLWAKNNMREYSRIFYILPTKVSINAMFKRIEGYLENKSQVSLLYSNVYSYIENLDVDKERKTLLKKVLRKIYSPIKVTTVFQLLKLLFGSKGFERGLVELTNSCIIVDEIHTYDAHITALLLSLLKILVREYNAKVCLMSATFPSFLRKIFADELDIETIVINEFTDCGTRHRLHLLSGNILDNKQRILQTVADGKRALVVCNTVRRAREVYLELKKDIKNIVLLHSRFIPIDRTEKEDIVIHKQVDLVVSTQVIEVSLDIDYDVIFTEPAPIDSLLQRFGRVNRKGRLGIADVFVVKEGSGLGNIYNRLVVERTLSIMEQQSNISIVDLTADVIDGMVETVYSNGFAGDEFKFKYVLNSAEQMWSTIYPFMRYNQESFYNLFESRLVVPKKFESEIVTLIDDNREYMYIDYAINLHKYQIGNLYKLNRLYKIGDVFIVDCGYDSELGLQCDYKPNKKCRII